MRISNGQEVDINKTTILAVEEAAEDAKFMLAASADEMNGQEWKFVTRHRAAVVLGISKSELGRLSHQSDFVYTESADDEKNTSLTNEELQQVYRLGQVH